MAFQIAGKVIKIFDEEQKSESFKVRQFVIEVNEGQYPQMVSFQLTQDRCSLADGYNEGDEVNVHFDLRGREWNGKYFTNLNAWRIENGTGDASESQGSSQSGSQQSSSNQGGAYQAPKTESSANPQPDFDDDIPF